MISMRSSGRWWELGDDDKAGQPWQTALSGRVGRPRYELGRVGRREGGRRGVGWGSRFHDGWRSGGGGSRWLASASTEPGWSGTAVKVHTGGWVNVTDVFVFLQPLVVLQIYIT